MFRTHDTTFKNIPSRAEVLTHNVREHARWSSVWVSSMCFLELCAARANGIALLSISRDDILKINHKVIPKSRHDCENVFLPYKKWVTLISNTRWPYFSKNRHELRKKGFNFQ